MSSAGPIGACCNIQTTDANASGYVPPCCLAEVLDERPAATVLGKFFGPRRVFQFLPRPPRQ